MGIAGRGARHTQGFQTDKPAERDKASHVGGAVVGLGAAYRQCFFREGHAVAGAVGSKRRQLVVVDIACAAAKGDGVDVVVRRGNVFAAGGSA